MRRFFASSIFLCFIFLSFQLPAQEEEKEQLEGIKGQIQKSEKTAKEMEAQAKAVAAEASKITNQQITLAEKIHNQEAALSQTRERLQLLEGEIATKKESISAQNQNLAQMLAALQRLSQRPPEFILMRPAKAVETIRSATLLTGAMPEIERKTDILRQDLTILAELKQELNEERVRLDEGLEELKTQNQALVGLIQEKRALYADYLSGAEQERKRAQRLGREAQTLQTLIKRLEAERQNRASSALPTPPLPAGSSFRKAKGQMPYPVRGKLTQNFGQADSAGKTRGINIQTLSGGQVIAPFDGRIIYSGPFRDYGQLLILAHSDGYHTLLAGLGRIDVLVGQWVLAGEPLGVMPQTRLASTKNDSNVPGPELYLEIREKGEPINPVPWLKNK